MARTLYSYARVLPAYTLYRACRDSPGSAARCHLSYQLHSSRDHAAAAASAAGAGAGGAGAQQRTERYAFAPIDTATGSFRAAVTYRPSVAVVAEGRSDAVSIPQHVITNYVPPRGVRHCVLAALRCAASLALFLCNRALTTSAVLFVVASMSTSQPPGSTAMQTM